MATRAPYYTERHETLRAAVIEFAETDIAPFAHDWDEAEDFPRELYEKAATSGVLGAGFPAEYGGRDGDIFDKIIVKEELARVGSGGVRASLLSHGIGLPPILNLGRAEMKNQVAPAVLAGEKISCLAITEPTGGSDVANLKTAAERDGDHYVVNGQKTLITSGFRADYYTVAVRTGGAGKGGISLLLIERDTPGFTRERLHKMGWWASDTATLTFENCRVPVENIIGQENRGFIGIVQNFNEERLGNTAIMLGAAKACLEVTIEHARTREVFGKVLMANQVVRHKIADMAMRVQATESRLDTVAWQFQKGEGPVAEIALLKNLAAKTYEFCATEAVQLHGGAGIVRGSKAERLFRESKILSIGGGATEIMKDLAARQMGL